jgi:3-polyprenyl-4-hydroxybenzoate decarboxylase
MQLDPVFHVTAITMRKDALHQSVLHGAGRVLGRVESANFVAIHLEACAFDILEKLGIDIRDARVTTSSGEGQHLRIAISQTAPGQARQAIKALFAELCIVKHIFVVDDDVDIWSESAMEWAMGTRFQAHKDLAVLTGMLGHRMDPSLGEDEAGAKAGFDMTVPFGFGEKLLEKVTDPPVLEGPGRFQDVARALAGGPMYFTEIMQAVGSRDGREIALRLDELRNEGSLIRNEDGQYYLGAGQKGMTVLDHEPHKEKRSAK